MIDYYGDFITDIQMYEYRWWTKAQELRGGDESTGI